MDERDRDKLKQINRDRKEANKKFTQLGSEVYKAFLDLEQVTFADGHLKKFHKELIALGISVVVNCESCMDWHIQEALRTGASVDQVLEAIGVGIEMGGGPATVSSRFALKALEYHKK
ncbi:MAG: carboxymuconolactone decarboxylase family protein [Candidatus Ranarchaeia archaeon]|jgi:AhpD family alkylhydroperoxidase